VLPGRQSRVQPETGQFDDERELADSSFVHARIESSACAHSARFQNDREFALGRMQGVTLEVGLQASPIEIVYATNANRGLS
jgi:hypothetical protein